MAELTPSAEEKARELLSGWPCACYTTPLKKELSGKVCQVHGRIAAALTEAFEAGHTHAHECETTLAAIKATRKEADKALREKDEEIARLRDGGRDAMYREWLDKGYAAAEERGRRQGIQPVIEMVEKLWEGTDYPPAERMLSQLLRAIRALAEGKP